MFDNSNQNKKASLKKNLKTSTNLLITTFLAEVYIVGNPPTPSLFIKGGGRTFQKLSHFGGGGVGAMKFFARKGGDKPEMGGGGLLLLLLL